MNKCVLFCLFILKLKRKAQSLKSTNEKKDQKHSSTPDNARMLYYVDAKDVFYFIKFQMILSLRSYPFLGLIHPLQTGNPAAKLQFNAGQKYLKHFASVHPRLKTSSYTAHQAKRVRGGTTPTQAQERFIIPTEKRQEQV